MADSVHTVNKADPVKAFKALASILGDKEGVEIILKELTKKEEVSKKENI